MAKTARLVMDEIQCRWHFVTHWTPWRARSQICFAQRMPLQVLTQTLRPWNLKCWVLCSVAASTKWLATNELRWCGRQNGLFWLSGINSFADIQTSCWTTMFESANRNISWPKQKCLSGGLYASSSAGVHRQAKGMADLPVASAGKFMGEPVNLTDWPDLGAVLYFLSLVAVAKTTQLSMSAPFLIHLLTICFQINAWSVFVMLPTVSCIPSNLILSKQSGIPHVWEARFKYMMCFGINFEYLSFSGCSRLRVFEVHTICFKPGFQSWGPDQKPLAFHRTIRPLLSVKPESHTMNTAGSSSHIELKAKNWTIDIWNCCAWCRMSRR